MRITMPFSKQDADSAHSKAAIPPSKGPATVEEAIEQFELSKLPSKWRNIGKRDLLADIKRTMKDPFQINQNYTPFCGPASIAFEMVSRKPIQYVRFLKQIFELGQFKTETGKIIKASRKLLESKKPDEITVADWVFIGTLRDDRNLFIPVKSKGGADNPSGIAGMTGVPAMMGWTKHILGFKKAKYKSAALFGDIKALKKVHQAYNDHGVAFLLIHKGLVEGTLTQWGGPQVPNHWVVYLGNLKLKDKNVSDSVQFDTYTWGNKVHVSTDKQIFRQYFVGAVIGE